MTDQQLTTAAEHEADCIARFCRLSDNERAYVAMRVRAALYQAVQVTDAKWAGWIAEPMGAAAKAETI